MDVFYLVNIDIGSKVICEKYRTMKECLRLIKIISFNYDIMEVYIEKGIEFNNLCY